MRCKYLEEEIIRYCKAYPVRKEIPASPTDIISKCLSDKYVNCPIYKEYAEEGHAEKCPFLEEELVRYCNGYPIRKAIPSQSIGADDICLNDKHKDCEVFKNATNKGGVMKKIRGSAQFFPQNFWKSCRPRSCPVCPYEPICMAASLEKRDVTYIDGFMWLSNLHYHPKHMWMEVANDGTTRIGLDDFARKIIGEVHEFGLPEKGLEIHEGENMLKVVSDGRTLNLRSPINGTIKRINTKLVEKPDLFNEDPFKQWMFRIEPKDLENTLNNFLFGPPAESWIERDIDRLRYRIESEVGVTVADGGAVLPTVQKIDDKDWENLVKEFLFV